MPDLNQVIEQVVKDKGVSREIIVEALEAAVLTAARKKFGPYRSIEVQYNPEMGEVELFEFKNVVEKITNKYTEVTLDEAKDLDPDAEVGDSLGMKMDTTGFGRIAAQTAKQIIIQRVRDAEREIIYQEFKDRKGEVINGIVRRFERGNMVVDLGRTEAVLPPREQIPREVYRPGDRIRAYVLDIQQTSRGPQIILSRTCPDLLNKLFEMEVPEIFEGIVRIEGAAREPGARAKIAVYSSDRDVDPVGACVGVRGSRVQSVVQELRGEKIDIVPWDPDMAKFVCNALAPSQISKVIIDEDSKTMEVIVPDDQLSLAIGRKGQNVRLAVQLTGWKIDIHTETEIMAISERSYRMFTEIPGVDEDLGRKLFDMEFQSVDDIAQMSVDDLKDILDGNLEKAQELKLSAQAYLATRSTDRVSAEETGETEKTEEAAAASPEEVKAESEGDPGGNTTIPGSEGS